MSTKAKDTTLYISYPRSNIATVSFHVGNPPVGEDGTIFGDMSAMEYDPGGWNRWTYHFSAQGRHINLSENKIDYIITGPIIARRMSWKEFVYRRVSQWWGRRWS